MGIQLKSVKRKTEWLDYCFLNQYNNNYSNFVPCAWSNSISLYKKLLSKPKSKNENKKFPPELSPLHCVMAGTTDYGRPISFFSSISRCFGLGQTHWADKFWGISFGVFSAKLSASILVQWVPCPCFPWFNHYFYKKLNLHIHNIPNHSG